MATVREVETWFRKGVRDGAIAMLVVMNDYNDMDYPIFVMPQEQFQEKFQLYDGKDLQRVVAVYLLTQDLASQMAEPSVYH